MIVLDASAVVEVLLRTPIGEVVRHRWRRQGAVAPSLVDVEVLHVVRRLVIERTIDGPRGGRSIGDLAALPIDRQPHELLLRRMWQLRGNLTAYDAAYVALAEAFTAPLLTCDAKLAASPVHRAEVDLLVA